MGKIATVVMALLMAGCGYSSRDNEIIGQVKKVVRRTPIICPNRWDIDVSLGVLRGGVGSMSSEDVWLTVDDPSILATLKSANETGAIVKMKYNVARIVFCANDHFATSAEIIK